MKMIVNAFTVFGGEADVRYSIVVISNDLFVVVMSTCNEQVITRSKSHGHSI